MLLENTENFSWVSSSTWKSIWFSFWQGLCARCGWQYLKINVRLAATRGYREFLIAVCPQCFLEQHLVSTCYEEAGGSRARLCTQSPSTRWSCDSFNVHNILFRSERKRCSWENGGGTCSEQALESNLHAQGNQVIHGKLNRWCTYKEGGCLVWEHFFSVKRKRVKRQSWLNEL